jgi:hypothetical protein
MGRAIVSFLFHAFRVVLAAVTMLVVAFGLWVLIGTTTAILGIQSPTLVLLSAIAISVAAFSGGGYVSARYITARSLLHPTLAAGVLAGIYESIFTRGDIGIAAAMPIAAAVVAAGGAALARVRGGPA